MHKLQIYLVQNGQRRRGGKIRKQKSAYAVKIKVPELNNRLNKDSSATKQRARNPARVQLFGNNFSHLPAAISVLALATYSLLSTLLYAWIVSVTLSLVWSTRISQCRELKRVVLTFLFYKRYVNLSRQKSISPII